MHASTIRYSLGLTILSGTLALSLGACGGGDDNNSPGGGGTGATGGSGGSGGTGAGGTGGSGATGASGGSGGSDAGSTDGNDTMETATAITLGAAAVQANLSPPGVDVDWYKFDGTAGQPIVILTQAKTGADKFDVAYPDLVITLYDASGTQLAEQDDPTPSTSNDPFLLTVLPSAGTYFLRVLECNQWEKGGSANCSDASLITNKNYALSVSELAFTSPGEIKEAEPNGDAATATALTFSPNTANPGHYYLSTTLGTFADGSDVNVYSLTVPSDLSVDTGARAVANFYPQPAGTDGNGSTTTMGEVYLTTAADPTTIVAKVDVSVGASFDVPVSVGTDYLAFYARAASPTGSNDFYFDLPGFSSGNPLEVNEVANGSLATPDALTESTSKAGSFYIEGDLAPADLDHFSVTVPATNADTVSVACGAQRSGSGLRGFTMELLKSDGTSIASMVEAADKDALIDKSPVPAGETKLVLKVSATSQAADVTSTFYRCGVHFAATTP